MKFWEWWWWPHNIVNVPNVTESYTPKIVNIGHFMLYVFCHNKNNNLGTTLVVQWLIIHLPMQGTQLWCLVGELRSHVLWGYWASRLHLLGPSTLEPILLYKRSLHITTRESKEHPAQPTLKKKKNAPLGLPWWLTSRQFAWQCRRHRFNSWSGKLPYTKDQLSLSTTTIEPVL